MSDLPPGWEWTTLGEVSTSIRNGIFVSRPGTEPAGVPILRINSVRPLQLRLDDLRYTGIDEADLAKRDALLAAGDLLFTRYSGSKEFVGVAAVVPDSAGSLTYPDKLIRVRVDRSVVDPMFVAMAFAEPATRARVERRLKTTAGQVGIAGSGLADVEFPLAPVAEQRHIVNTVDARLQQIAYATRLLGESLAKLPLATAAARACVVGSAGSASGAEGVLADVLDRIEAGRSFGGSTRPANPDEWGIVKVSAMTWGRFDETQNKQIAAEAAVPRYEIRSGDILVSRANTEAYVGAPVLVGDVRPRLLLSDKSLRLVPRPGVDGRWLLHVLASPGFRAHVSRTATGTKDSMRNISQAALLQAPIVIPQQGEQSRVADELDEQLQDLERLRSSVRVAMARSDQLRKSVLADAFTGRLVPQDPSDEPASELLARIRAERAAEPKEARKSRSPRRASS